MSRKVSVAVHLTKAQAGIFQDIIRNWRHEVNMSLVGRRLLQYLLSGKATLEELLRKYQAEFLDLARKNKSRVLRDYKFSIYVNQEDKQNLSTLGEHWFYLPGEVARILVELFIKRVITENDIRE